MADANSISPDAIFKLRDCNICGGHNVPHYKSSGSGRCVSCHKEYQRQYRSKAERGVPIINKDKKYALKKRYGLSAQGFADIGERQQWSCAGCGLKFDLSQRAFYPHVDHCHKTGEVRGLLCNGCNRALGFISDDPEIARGLASYLERS